MQYRITVFTILLVCAAIVSAGCTGTQSSPGTTAPGTAADAVPLGSSIITAPTDTVPDQNMVTVDIGEKDYLGTIPVIFQGGTGQIHVKKIEVMLYRSDGETRTTSIPANKGASVDLEGTKQTDRVVVFITFDNGQRLKTNDLLSPYRTRP